MTSHTTNRNIKPNIIFLLQTRRPAESFLSFNSSLAQLAEELRSCQMIACGHACLKGETSRTPKEFGHIYHFKEFGHIYHFM